MNIDSNHLYITKQKFLVLETFSMCYPSDSNTLDYTVILRHEWFNKNQFMDFMTLFHICFNCLVESESIFWIFLLCYTYLTKTRSMPLLPLVVYLIK